MERPHNSTHAHSTASTAPNDSLFMRVPVHSPWLPGNIDVAQTILIILTMAGLFPDRPCTLGILMSYLTHATNIFSSFQLYT